MLQFMSVGQRAQRTLLAIAFFYALFNGSPYNLLNGLWVWAWHVPWSGPFWMTMQGIVFLAIVLGLLAFMLRRWQLTKTQANLPILVAMTLSLTLAIVFVVALIGKGLELSPASYWNVFQWVWQIPAGFFVGTGLSWSIKDRQLAGVVAVDQRDVVNDPQAFDHHHTP